MRTLLPLVLVLAIGCAKKSPEVATTTPPPVVEQPQQVTVEEEPSTPTRQEIDNQLVENFKRVHFEFDSARLRPEAMTALRENARILQDHPDVSVRIEGHADERGTTEYNLALAQQRANAVREALTSMGVPETALELVSFGEERPLVRGEGESVWSVNRRAEFRVLRDPDGTVDGTIDAPPQRDMLDGGRTDTSRGFRTGTDLDSTRSTDPSTRSTDPSTRTDTTRDTDTLRDTDPLNDPIEDDTLGTDGGAGQDSAPVRDHDVNAPNDLGPEAGDDTTDLDMAEAEEVVR